MRHVREHRWWLAACGGGCLLAALIGGWVGPIIAVFAIVYLAGSVLIECESGNTNPPGDLQDEQESVDADSG